MDLLNKRWINGLALLMLAGLACDTLDPEGAPVEYVVESYQIATQPLQPVWLSQTTSVDERYNPEALAVQEADVQILRLSASGSIEQTYTFTERPDQPGTYEPDDPVAVIEPLQAYRLEVQMRNGDQLKAQTVVPDTFQLLHVNYDTLIYQGNEQLEMTITQSQFPDRSDIFLLSTEALDPTMENLTPVAASAHEDGNRLEDLARDESGVVDESLFIPRADQTLVIRYPWLGLAFFGPNRLFIHAIDDNLYDFYRSAEQQKGTLRPGAIPNVLDHIEGGTGIFAAYAKVSTTVVIKPD